MANAIGYNGGKIVKVKSGENLDVGAGQLEVNVIAESTSGSGVTIDGVLIKDNDIVIPNGSTIGSVGGPGAIAIDASGNVTLAANLTISGTTATVNTTNLDIEDPLIQLAKGNDSGDAVDIGFVGKYDTSGSQDLYAGLFRDANDSGKWKLFKDTQEDLSAVTTINTGATGYATGTLVADLEGNVNGTITVADESTDTSCSVLFVTAATGNLAPKTAGGLTFNANTDTLTATAFAGPLTGNVTGNCSGTAGSLASAQNFSLTGEVTASAISFNGTGAVALSTVVADNKIDASNLKGPSSSALPNGSSGQVLKSAGDGTFDWETLSSMSFVLEDADGTEVTITQDKEIKFIGGTNVTINWTDTSDGTDGDPYDLTFSLTTGISDTNLLRIDHADAANGDYAKLTANGVQGRSTSEVKTDLSLNLVENTALSTWAGSGNLTTTGALNSGSITSGFGNINNGTSSLDTGNANINGDITLKGSPTNLKLIIAETGLQAGENGQINQGHFLYVSANGKLSRATNDVSSGGSAKARIIGMCANDTSGGALALNTEIKLALPGQVVALGATVSGASAGDALYLHTGGQFTATAPTADNTAVVQVGILVDNSSSNNAAMLFNPVHIMTN